MTALSFNERFAPAILAGTKRQTIRARRKRPIQPGETLHLFTGLRTAACRRLGMAHCAVVEPVRIDWWHQTVRISLRCNGEITIVDDAGRDGFARADGFADWHDMAAFFREAHGDVSGFSGHLIVWRDFAPALAKPEQAP